MNIEKLEKLLAEATPEPWKANLEAVNPEVCAEHMQIDVLGRKDTYNAQLIVALRNLAPELVTLYRAANVWQHAMDDDAEVEAMKVVRALDALSDKLTRILPDSN